jgi:hypothetical protein
MTIPNKPRQSRTVNNETNSSKQHIRRERSQTLNASTNKDQSKINSESDNKSDNVMSDSYRSTTTTEDSDDELETKDKSIPITFTRSEPWFIDVNKTACKLNSIPFNSNLDLLKKIINVNFALNDPGMSLPDTSHDGQILTASNETIMAPTTFQFFFMGAAMVSVLPSYEHSAS